MNLHKIDNLVLNFWLEELHSSIKVFMEMQKLDSYYLVGNIDIKPLPKGMIMCINSQNKLTIELEAVINHDPIFVQVMIMHELHHKFVQNMKPNMKEANHQRDYFGDQIITEMDIDADLNTYILFSEQGKFNFNGYLNLLYNELAKDKDYRIRKEKFNRYFGSLLSIYNYTQIGERKIFYPYIDSCNDDTIYFAVIGNGRDFSKCELRENLILKLIQMYHETNKFYAQEFISLHQEVFETVTNQINKKTA